MDLQGWPHNGFWPHFMLMTVYLFLFCCLLMIVVSLLTKHAPYEEDFGDARRRDTLADRKGAGALGWVLWGILAAVMVSLFIGFQLLAKCAHGANQPTVPQVQQTKESAT
jgi:SSS family solute:Na+ symporter